MKWLIVLSVFVASAVASDWEILPKCDGKDWQYFPDPGSNCRSYFRCENGRPVRHNCDHGLLFDTNTMSCNWEQAVHCAPPPNYPTNPNNPFPQPPLNQPGQQPGFPGQQPGHPGQQPGYPGQHPSPAGFCPPHEDPQFPTHLADMHDCTKFFKCLNGRPIPQNCPTGTHWNDAVKYCDYPGTAQCWKRMKTIR